MSPRAQDPETEATRNTVIRFNEAFNRHDVDAVMALMTGVREGKPGRVRGIDLFRVREGRVAEKLSYVKG
jgi:ketosteroid isomerase-like protein